MTTLLQSKALLDEQAALLTKLERSAGALRSLHGALEVAGVDPPKNILLEEESPPMLIARGEALEFRRSENLKKIALAEKDDTDAALRFAELRESLKGSMHEEKRELTRVLRELATANTGLTGAKPSSPPDDATAETN